MKYGNAYINYINCGNYLSKRFDLLSEKPSVNYDARGVTSENFLGMYINHDQNILNEKPHPQTKTQIQQQEKGKKKQKEIQQKKKQTESTGNDKNNDNIGHNENFS